VDALLSRKTLLEEEIREVSRRVGAETREIDQKVASLLERLVREQMPGYEAQRGRRYNPGDLRLGYHECSGPIGRCVYDHPMDPGHDGCLFCGDPNEQK
jgi:hypothetical protein